MPSSIVVTTADLFARTAAEQIAGDIGDVVAVRGRCSMALCGGQTPVPVYRHLATIPVPWHRVSIYFGDERAVPPDTPDSNYGMACRALLDHLPELPSSVHRIEADRPDRDGAARDYDRLLPPQLDVLLLGIGPDGHTASLFPGSPAVTDTRTRVVAVPPPPLPLQPQVARITITGPVITAARQIVVMATGAEKAALLARALEGPDAPTTLPAQLARNGTWILDQAAAGNLQPRNI